MKKLSIIVPVYQVKNYVKDCLDSILSQTFSDWEMIIVDDGSTDGSSQICDEYTSDKIKVFHTENHGLSAARNLGLKYASGEYISFIDSDDLIEKDYYEVMVGLAEKFDADIVCSKICIMGKTPSKAFRQTILLENEEAMKNLIIQNIYNHGVCTKIYRSQIAKQVNFFVGYTSEDVIYSYQTFKRSKRVVSTSYQGYLYRIRDNSIMTAKFSNKNFDLFRLMQFIKNDINIHYKKLIKIFEDKLVYCQLYYLSKTCQLKNYREFHSMYKEVFKGLKNSLFKFRHRHNLPFKLRLKTYFIICSPIAILKLMNAKYFSSYNYAISKIIHNLKTYPSDNL